MPKASTDPTKKVAMIQLPKEARRLMKMFAFSNEISNGEVIEAALTELYKRNPDFLLAPAEGVTAPKTRRQQAAE